MKTLVLIAVLLVAVPAYGWNLEELNKTVNQTNFIVARGCSGTLISLKHKLVLTNHHCVDGYISTYEKDEVQADGTVKKVRRERREEVKISQKAYAEGKEVGETSYQSAIVAHKKTADLALLKILADSLPYTVESKLLPAGVEVMRGEWVFVVGNPAGLDATVIMGIISSVNRREKFYWTENEEVPFLQFSGGVWFGNSGGALYSAGGYLIGVPAVIAGTPHLGLAIHYNAIRKFLSENCYGDLFSPTSDSYEVCSKKKEEEKAKSDKGKKTE